MYASGGVLSCFQSAFAARLREGRRVIVYALGESGAGGYESACCNMPSSYRICWVSENGASSMDGSKLECGNWEWIVRPGCTEGGNCSAREGRSVVWNCNKEISVVVLADLSVTVSPF